MNYRIPTCWSECNEYQLQKISDVLLKNRNKIGVNETVELLRSVFIPKDTIWEKIKFKWLLNNYSLREFIPYLSFLNTMPKVYHFPIIKGLISPRLYLSSLTIKQFSLADKLFYEYQTTQDLLKLRQLVATLYCIDRFSEENLSNVAEITDNYPHLWHRVLLAYISCRQYIIEKYPKIFPPTSVTEEVIKPELTKGRKSYTSFNDVIITLAFEKPQPLGTYNQAKNTSVYEFLTVLTSSIIRQEKIEKDAKRK